MVTAHIYMIPGVVLQVNLSRRAVPSATLPWGITQGTHATELPAMAAAAVAAAAAAACRRTAILGDALNVGPATLLW